MKHRISLFIIIVSLFFDIMTDFILQNVVFAGLVPPPFYLLILLVPTCTILIASLLLMINTLSFDNFLQVTAKVEQKKEVNKLDAWLFKQDAIHLK
ncbi:MAG: hypothetical protein M0P00_06430 [Bacteroidaceae bacterium]|nr:hypothetical protein [Bacteroidaceae bacterium]